MNWKFTFTLWVFSLLAFTFVGAVFITMMKNAMKEVVLFYLAEKTKWIDKLEEKLGKGSVVGSVFRN